MKLAILRISFAALLVAVLFGCAGRWDLPFFWVWLALLVATVVVVGLCMDPDLKKERFWQQTIERQGKSGQTVRESCEPEALKDCARRRPEAAASSQRFREIENILSRFDVSNVLLTFNQLFMPSCEEVVNNRDDLLPADSRSHQVGHVNKIVGH